MQTLCNMPGCIAGLSVGLEESKASFQSASLEMHAGDFEVQN